jgi:hypothetical protein
LQHGHPGYPVRFDEARPGRTTGRCGISGAACAGGSRLRSGRVSPNTGQAEQNGESIALLADYSIEEFRLLVLAAQTSPWRNFTRKTPRCAERWVPHVTSFLSVLPATTRHVVFRLKLCLRSSAPGAGKPGLCTGVLEPSQAQQKRGCELSNIVPSLMFVELILSLEIFCLEARRLEQAARDTGPRHFDQLQAKTGKTTGCFRRTLLFYRLALSSRLLCRVVFLSDLLNQKLRSGVLAAGTSTCEHLPSLAVDQKLEKLSPGI